MAIEVLKNNNTIEVTPSVGKMSISTLNQGFDNEKKIFKFSGRVKKNTPTTIGEMTITAAENKKFLKAPVLQAKVNQTGSIKMKLKSINKDDNNNITSYTYYLVYTNDRKTTIANGLKYSLNLNTKSIVVVKKGINNVDFGSKIIDERGGIKNIKVYGTPGSDFKLAVTKFDEGDELEFSQSGWIENSEFEDSNIHEESILNEIRKNSTYNNDTGKSFDIIKSKIPSNGIYSFDQDFSQISSETRYSINIFPGLNGDLLGPNFNTDQWTKDRFGWNGWYSKILTQPTHPTLTLQATCSDGGTNTIGPDASTQTTINSSTPYNPDIYKIKGRYGFKAGSLPNTYTKSLDLDYVIVASKTLSIATNPYFSSGKPYLTGFDAADNWDSDLKASNWTNSLGSENGGTRINILLKSIALSGGNKTCTIKMKVDVIKWGTKDVTMALNLDNILNFS